MSNAQVFVILSYDKFCPSLTEKIVYKKNEKKHTKLSQALSTSFILFYADCQFIQKWQNRIDQKKFMFSNVFSYI